MKVQDLVDEVIDPDHLPEDCTNATPIMPDIKISETGILHLLKNFKPKKAAGPDKIKPVVLQELQEELVPMLKLLFERYLESGTVPSIWTSANVSPLFKKGDKSTAAYYGPVSDVIKLGMTENLGILGYLKIDRVSSRFPVPVSQMAHRLDCKQFSIKTKSF